MNSLSTSASTTACDCQEPKWAPESKLLSPARCLPEAVAVPDAATKPSHALIDVALTVAAPLLEHNDVVAVMFAGLAPISLVVCRQQPRSELNAVGAKTHADTVVLLSASRMRAAGSLIEFVDDLLAELDERCEVVSVGIWTPRYSDGTTPCRVWTLISGPLAVRGDEVDLIHGHRRWWGIERWRHRHRPPGLGSELRASRVRDKLVVPRGWWRRWLTGAVVVCGLVALAATAVDSVISAGHPETGVGIGVWDRSGSETSEIPGNPVLFCGDPTTIRIRRVEPYHIGHAGLELLDRGRIDIGSCLLGPYYPLIQN